MRDLFGHIWVFVLFAKFNEYSFLDLINNGSNDVYSARCDDRMAEKLQNVHDVDDS